MPEMQREPYNFGGSFCFQCSIKDIGRSAPEAELIAAANWERCVQRNRILALFKKNGHLVCINCLRRMIERGCKNEQGQGWSVYEVMGKRKEVNGVFPERDLHSVGMGIFLSTEMGR